jgi:hypothetical protein
MDIMDNMASQARFIFGPAPETSLDRAFGKAALFHKRPCLRML